MTKAERQHLDRVASLGCLLCQSIGLGPTPAQLHHIRSGQGLSQRAENWLVIPLCPEHHTGDSGIHGTRDAFKLARVSELDLLAETYRRLSE